jgi:hypothetical protein
MTETQGLIAGMLLFFAAYLYIFWPEKVLVNEREKTRMNDLLEHKE